MIKKIEYQYRVNSLSDFDNLSLPNAFKVYVQCRTQVENPTSTDIYSFDSNSSKIYISGKTIVDITVYDYSTIVENGGCIRDMLSEMLNERNLQMKLCFISRI